MLELEPLVFDPNLIMVVDDDRDIMSAITTALQTDLPNTRPLTAQDGDSCIKLFEESDPKPGVIVLDIMLPRRSGYLVMEKIKRKVPAKTKPPIVINITGLQGHRHQVYAESLGAFDYLAKPFRMERLLEAIKKAQKALAQLK